MSSNEIIYPDKWGPHVWQSLHYISLGYSEKPTEEQKQKYKAFFLLVKDTLPCSVCANHYAENLKKMPLSDEVLETRENLVKWLIDFHNVVNEMKEKPVIKYVDARKMIDTNRQCEQPIEYIETFTETKEEKPVQKSPTIPVKIVKKSGSNSVCSSNNNLLYTLVGLLVSLIFIAIIYKKT